MQEKVINVELDLKFGIMKLISFFYYDDERYFNLQNCIKNLDNYLQECKIHKLNWNTWATVGIDNSSAANYSQLCFKRNLKYLTKLDIRKR